MRISIWIIIGITAGLLLTAMVLLCVGVLLRKDHSFRSQHVSENERMRSDKIHCATAQDREARRENTDKIDVKKIDL
ncbi:MAG: hypothetical protein II605_00715 [Paludibacteraceae bacterium]|nr:hypothetical protein [Paludibacteraceae bacterium]MBQ2190606.1 hypothetical protein [Paludibacteraceae bacterium]MBQ2520417.1 hypothetical protein [Paludibacteraceae bacterium]MBQ4017744.1 hypothetical protein [Paludibacteraceae bacterium]MBQ5378783.1 hypothetical protein [Paludibacteraceae bacterium]